MSLTGELDLAATAMVAGGRALARDADGQVVFVDGALPGERVRVAIETERRGDRTARVVEVLEPSPQRVAPPCPELARGCGACQWQHIDVGAQRSLKSGIVRDALRRIGGLEAVPEHATVACHRGLFAPPFGSVSRTVVPDSGEARSHASVAVEDCLVAHPILVPLITDARYPKADEVLLRCGSRTGERLAVPTPSRKGIVVPGDVRSDFIHEEAAGQRWRISAASFFQTRPDGVDALALLVGRAADQLGVATTALDLYSGVGLFAGVLAARGWSVTAVESSSSAVGDARTNLRSLRVKVVAADVSKWTPVAAELVVADPSRQGLGRRGVAVIDKSSARRLVLVSCDAASLGRDTALLRDAGFEMTALTPVDLFPHTFHVEVVTVFDR